MSVTVIDRQGSVNDTMFRLHFLIRIVSRNEHLLLVTINQTVGTVGCSATTGDEYLEMQGIAYQTAWDLWQNIMALGIIAIGMMTIAYILLRLTKKLK
jgi:hypothetical protein